jgi:LAO/AO transport system kinase
MSGTAPDEDAEASGGGRWEIPVLQTTAHSGEGVDGLLEAISSHRSFLEGTGALQARREARAAGRVRDVVEREIRKRTWRHAEVRRVLDRGVAEIVAGRETPYSLAEAIISELMVPGTK